MATPAADRRMGQAWISVSSSIIPLRIPHGRIHQRPLSSTTTTSSAKTETSPEADGGTNANTNNTNTTNTNRTNTNNTNTTDVPWPPPPMGLRRLSRYLSLQTYDRKELDEAFDVIYRCRRRGDIADVTDSYGSLYSSSGPGADDFSSNVGGGSLNDVGVLDEGRGSADLDDLAGRHMGEGTIGHADVEAFLVRRISELDDASANGKGGEGGEGGCEEDREDREEREKMVRRYAADEARRFLSAFRDGAVPAHRHESPANDAGGSSSSTPSSTPSPPPQPPQSLVVTRSAFRRHLLHMASEIDTRRTIPIAISMLLVGSSVGIVTPVMPFVVEQMGLSAGQYGVVVSSFALAKILGNVPSAILVERHGRKPYLVHSLLLVSLGVGGIGLATNMEHLVVCRLCTGLGVAALSTAATMTMADISTPLNRASTMAPIMSAFAAGTAFGPALGGLMADRLGISETFYVVGTSYLALTLVNHHLLVETQAKAMEFPWHHGARRDGHDGGSGSGSSSRGPSMVDASRDAVRQWAPLMADGRIRNTVAMNGLYWVALAGSQMTILPLMLTDPNGLALSATAVGKTYMGMSLVQVAGVPLMAKFVDRIGKPLAIVAGTTLISSSMAALPLCADVYHMAAALGTWGLGSSILSTAPVSYISDVTSDRERAQALALMRTAGDVGFLLGASGIGAVADLTGDLGSAMHASAGVLLTATGWFAVRRVLRDKVRNE